MSTGSFSFTSRSRLLAADALAGIEAAANAVTRGERASLDAALERIAASVRKQSSVLQRIPEKMDPHVYFRAFRPYIRFFENVVYEGVESAPHELSRRNRSAEQHHAVRSSPS